MLIDMGADASISGLNGSVGEVAKVFIPSGLRTATVPRGSTRIEFVDFSDEMIVYIFQFLKTPKSLLMVGHVCTLFRQISQDSRLWRTVSGQEKPQFCDKIKKQYEDKKVIASKPAGHYDHLFKLIIIGDSEAGKSSLLLRYTDDSFTESYNRTMGIDFKIRTVNVEDRIVKLQMWDKPLERFRTINHSHYRGGHGIILVYDVTDQVSFNNCRQWILEIERHACSDVSKILIGNKCDMTTKRVIEYATAKEFADASNMLFSETSAKDSTNVTEAFTMIVQAILKRVLENSKQDVPLSTLIPSPKTKKKGILNKLFGK